MQVYKILKRAIERQTYSKEKLQQQIAILQEDRSNLEFALLDTDFRLTCMELKNEGILE